MSTLSVDVPVLSPAHEAVIARVAPAEIALAARAERNPTLDAARLLAAFGLVWVHTAEASTALSRAGVLGRFGTSFFVLASIFFLLRRGPKGDEEFWSYAKGRFRRLYVPFLAWSLIYLVARLVNRLFFNGPPIPDLGPLRLLVGTSGQFWFLPFLLAAGVACYPLRYLLPRMHNGVLWVAPAAIAIGAAIACTPRPGIWLNNPDAQRLLRSVWTFSPSVFWAIAITILFRRLPRRVTTSRWIAVLGLSILIASISSMWLIALHPIARNLAGVGLFLIALVPFQSTVLSSLAPLGCYSFGIYLAHPLLIACFKAMARGLGQAQQWWTDLLIFAAAFIGSYLLTRLLRSNRWTAWMIP